MDSFSGFEELQKLIDRFETSKENEEFPQLLENMFICYIKEIAVSSEDQNCFLQNLSFLGFLGFIRSKLLHFIGLQCLPIRSKLYAILLTKVLELTEVQREDHKNKGPYGVIRMNIDAILPKALYANFSQCDQRFKSSAGVQCLAMCAFAALVHHNLNIRGETLAHFQKPEDLDAVLVSGDKFYHYCCSKHCLDVGKELDYFSIRNGVHFFKDLPWPSFHLCYYLKDFSEAKKYEQYIESADGMIFCHEPSRRANCIMRDSTTGQYAVLDSHHRASLIFCNKEEITNIFYFSSYPVLLQLYKFRY